MRSKCVIVSGLAVIASAVVWILICFSPNHSQPEKVIPHVLSTSDAEQQQARFPKASQPGYRLVAPQVSDPSIKPTDLQVFTRFSDWAADHLAGHSQVKDHLLAEGERFALARRKAMKELIRTHPRQAL